jgi:SRSO17 transposase
VQQLQFFLSESTWDAAAIASRTLQLLSADPLTSPTADGVLVIDDTGDRKDGGATDHVARQYLGSVGKIDNGIVAVPTLWAHELRYYPLHVMPYTPESRLADGKQDPSFQTKPQIALALVERAQGAGIPFKALVADCFYGETMRSKPPCGNASCPMYWRIAAWSDAAGRLPTSPIRLTMQHVNCQCALDVVGSGAFATVIPSAGGPPN